MATWYVDNNASGTNAGTSWANAWESFADIVWGGAGVVAGDTLYISGGAATKTYAETLNTGASGSAGSRITIKVGQDANHTGTVIITGQLIVDQHHVTISGQVGSGSDCKISVRHNGTQDPAIAVYDGYSIILEYVEMTQCQWNYVDSGGGFIDWTADLIDGDDSQVRYCKIHDQNDESGYTIWVRGSSGNYLGALKFHHNEIYNFLGDCFQITSTGVDIYDNYIHDVLPGSGEHPDGVQCGSKGYLRIYNNEFTGWVDGDGTATGNSYIRWNPTGDANPTRFYIYNNLFHETVTPDEGFHRGIELSTNTTIPKDSVTHVYVCNNVFWNIGDMSCYYLGLDGDTAGVSDYYILNNVFGEVQGSIIVMEPGPYGDPPGMTRGSWGDGADLTVDNNYVYASGSPYQVSFTWGPGHVGLTYAQWVALDGVNDNGANTNPGLTTALKPSSGASAVVGAGVNLNSYFTTDKDGVTRAETWDVGAYEFSEESSTKAGIYRSIF